MKNEFNVNYIWSSLSDFWTLFDDKETVSQLWRGYIFVVRNLYYQLYQLSLSKSIDRIPYEWISDWEKLTFDDSTRISSSDPVYPFKYQLPSAIKNVVTLAESPRNTIVLPAYTSVSKEYEGELVLPDGSSRLPGDAVYTPYRAIDYNGRHFFPDGIEVDTVRYQPGKDYVVNESEHAISFRREPYSEMWTNQSIRNVTIIYDNFGCLIDHYGLDSYNYLRQVQGLWFTYWNGATIESIRKGATVLCGLPFVETDGIVETVDITPRTATIGSYTFNAAEDVFRSLKEGSLISSIDLASCIVSFTDHKRICVGPEYKGSFIQGETVSSRDFSLHKVYFDTTELVNISSDAAYKLESGKYVAYVNYDSGKLCIGDGYTRPNGEFYVDTAYADIKLPDPSNVHVGSSIVDIDYNQGKFRSSFTLTGVFLSSTYGLNDGDIVTDVRFNSFETDGGRFESTNLNGIPDYIIGSTVASVDHDHKLISFYKEDDIVVGSVRTFEERNRVNAVLDKLMIGTYVSEILEDGSIRFSNTVTHIFNPEEAALFNPGNFIGDIDFSSSESGFANLELITNKRSVDVTGDSIYGFIPGLTILSLEESDVSVCLTFNNTYSVRLSPEILRHIEVGDVVTNLTDASTNVVIAGQSYTYAGDTNLNLVSGESVSKFEPLTDAVHVYDYINYPGWFSEYTGEYGDNRDTCEEAGDAYFDTAVHLDGGYFDAMVEASCLEKYFLQYFTFTVQIDSSSWFGSTEEMEVLKAFLRAVKPAYTDYIFQFTMELSDDAAVFDLDMTFQWEERMKDFGLQTYMYDELYDTEHGHPGYDYKVLTEHNQGVWTFDDQYSMPNFDEVSLFDAAQDMDNNLDIRMYIVIHSGDESGFMDYANTGFVFDDEAMEYFDVTPLTFDEGAYGSDLTFEWGKAVQLDRNKTIIRGETFKVEVTLYQDGQLVDFDPVDMYSDALFENGVRHSLRIEKDSLPGKYILYGDVDTWNLPGEQFTVNVGAYDNRGATPIIVASFNDTFYIVDSATDLSNERVGHF